MSETEHISREISVHQKVCGKRATAHLAVTVLCTQELLLQHTEALSIRMYVQEEMQTNRVRAFLAAKRFLLKTRIGSERKM